MKFIACMLPVVLAAPAALAQAVQTEMDKLGVEQLKAIYLLCSDATLRGRMSTSGTMHCSVAYEELKRRAFGGSFDQLLAWSRAQPAASEGHLSRTPCPDRATHSPAPAPPACR